MADDHETTLLIDGSAVPRPVAVVETLDIDGELVLLDPSTNGIHHLDRLGSVIWSVLDGTATVDELVADLAEAFATADDVVRKDLDDLLAGLYRIGVLEGVELPLSDHERIHAHEHQHADAGDEAVDDGLWKPVYLVNPPAP